MRTTLLRIAIGVLALSLGACRVGWAASHQPGGMTASYLFFTGTESGTAELADGETLVLGYEAAIRAGSLVIAVEGPDGSEIWRAELEDGRDEEVEIPAAGAGQYRITLSGRNARGDFAAAWTKRIARSPEQVVEEFYDWYLAYGSGAAQPANVLTERAYRSSGLLSPSFIEKADGLLEAFEAAGPGYDPFLCAQNTPPGLTVGEAEASGSGASVRVGYRSYGFTVSLAQLDGEWKIDDILCDFE